MECLRFYDRANHHYAAASIHRDWALNNHRPRLNERVLSLPLTLSQEREEDTDRHLQRSILAIARFHFYTPRPVTTSPIIRPFGITNDVEKKPRRPRSLFLLFALPSLLSAPLHLSFPFSPPTFRVVSPLPRLVHFSSFPTFLSLVQITIDISSIRSFQLEANLRTRSNRNRPLEFVSLFSTADRLI